MSTVGYLLHPPFHLQQITENCNHMETLGGREAIFTSLRQQQVTMPLQQRKTLLINQHAAPEKNNV